MLAKASTFSSTPLIPLSRVDMSAPNNPPRAGVVVVVVRVGVVVEVGVVGVWVGVRG